MYLTGQRALNLLVVDNDDGDAMMIDDALRSGDATVNLRFSCTAFHAARRPEAAGRRRDFAGPDDRVLMTTDDPSGRAGRMSG
ncbi:MAG TPA: hypothetical protein VHN18_13085 [Micromonosporaceae bacterium]|nr:hypothetical protein [Micromonosporaceae bacterium]